MITIALLPLRTSTGDTIITTDLHVSNSNVFWPGHHGVATFFWFGIEQMHAGKRGLQGQGEQGDEKMPLNEKINALLTRPASCFPASRHCSAFNRLSHRGLREALPHCEGGAHGQPSAPGAYHDPADDAGTLPLASPRTARHDAFRAGWHDVRARRPRAPRTRARRRLLRRARKSASERAARALRRACERRLRARPLVRCTAPGASPNMSRVEATGPRK